MTLDVHVAYTTISIVVLTNTREELIFILYWKSIRREPITTSAFIFLSKHFLKARAHFSTLQKLQTRSVFIGGSRSLEVFGKAEKKPEIKVNFPTKYS